MNVTLPISIEVVDRKHQNMQPVGKDVKQYIFDNKRIQMCA